MPLLICLDIYSINFLPYFYQTNNQLTNHKKHKKHKPFQAAIYLICIISHPNNHTYPFWAHT